MSSRHVPFSKLASGPIADEFKPGSIDLTVLHRFFDQEIPFNALSSLNVPSSPPSAEAPLSPAM